MNPFPNNFSPFNQRMLNNHNTINKNNNNFYDQNAMNNQVVMNQMIQMKGMMNMNPIIMPNMNNQNNNYIFNMNQNQKLLIDKIIDFYQKTGKIYMNYGEFNQIKSLLNNLDINNPLLKEGNDIDDPLPYINEKKKLIKFINHDSKIFNVKIPVSIDKKTLHDIASLYKTLEYSQILLVYMNCILHNDESPITSISDGDCIVIIEDIYYLDDTYFNSLNRRNYYEGGKNVPLKSGYKVIANMIIPKDTKLSQLYKALILHFGCGYKFLFHDKTIDEYDQRIITRDGDSIYCYEYDFVQTYLHVFGKIINLKIDFKDNKGNSQYQTYIVGIYNSTKIFVLMIEQQRLIKVNKFYLGDKMINFDEDISFLSLGVKEDMNGKIIYDDKVR
jgi:hypothetical protein